MIASSNPPPPNRLRTDALSIFHSGLAAVEAKAAVHRICRRENENLEIAGQPYNLSQFDRIIVIGAGKATADMASAMEDLLADRITRGVVVVKYDHIRPLKKIDIIEAGHPVPDAQGQKGARTIMDLAKSAGERDLVICLISGGGSALLPLPAEGLTLSHKQKTIEVLLSCGATIHEINAIRKHLSDIKGGKLARAAFPASLITLMISDVVGDDTDVIASGPTVPDGSTYRECLDVIQRYAVTARLPDAVRTHLRRGDAGELPETPKADARIFHRATHHIVCRNLDALWAAKTEAQRLGYEALMLSSMVEGETREVAKVHAAIAKEIRKTGVPLKPPACLLSGGETTVTLKGDGKGGRNQEFVLAASLALDGEPGILVLSGGTDGTDGPTDAAGAVASPDTLSRAQTLGLNPHHALRDNDAYPFFKALDDLLVTGPTRTNVMDLRIVLID